MKNFVQKIYLLCLFVAFSGLAMAADIPNNTIYYTSSNGKIVTPYNKNVFGANIISNTYVNGQGIITFDKSVTKIGDNAFNNCSSLTSVSIPNSVFSIWTNAFFGCRNLISVTIPNSVTVIMSNAFEGCESLASITIPNSVKYIENGTFQNCSGLNSITIPNSVISIGNDAFTNCYSLTSVNIPNSVTKIGRYAFNNCYRLTSITIPNSITQIDEYAFTHCRGLTSINVEKENINYDSRDNCNAIIETATNTLIAGCNNTKIPTSVRRIKSLAFVGCSLTSITIPNSVTFLESLAFNACFELTSITALSTTPPTCASSGTFSKYGTLHVLPGCKAAYQNADVWKNFTIVEDAIDPYRIVLADGETYNEETPQDNKNFNYTRTFNNTKWQALYIPFSMSYEDWKDDFEVAFVNSVRQYDNDEDGVVDETIMDVMKIKSGSLIPNTPYLIKAKSVGEKTITINNATLYQAEENSIECSTMLAKYTFTGTYSTIPASTMSANNYYAMGGGSLIMTDGTSDLKPFRWYLNIESRSPMYSVSNAAKTITINVVGEEEATGISQMSSDREHSSAIYDLNGRKMSQKTLKSGLYIKNGKKIIIK